MVWHRALGEGSSSWHGRQEAEKKGGAKEGEITFYITPTQSASSHRDTTANTKAVVSPNLSPSKGPVCDPMKLYLNISVTSTLSMFSDEKHRKMKSFHLFKATKVHKE